MSTNLKLSAAFVLLLAISLGAWLLFMDEPDSLCGERFEQDQARIVSGETFTEGITAIEEPQFEKAVDTTLADSEWILGLDLPNLTAAFPHSILVWHEIVNLEIEGERIAITYCPLSRSGIGFRDLHLGVTGKLLNSNLIAFDRKTNSLLPQIPGHFISGSLCGERPATVKLTACSWGNWRIAHPQTLVLSTNTGYTRDYSGKSESAPYTEYYKNDEIFFPLSARSDLLPPKTEVLCFERNGEHLAVAKQGFPERHPEGLELRLGGAPLLLTWDDLLKTIVASNHIQGVEAFWFAWYATHPDTRLEM